jgi:hypothetical protein
VALLEAIVGYASVAQEMGYLKMCLKFAGASLLRSYIDLNIGKRVIFHFSQR